VLKATEPPVPAAPETTLNALSLFVVNFVKPVGAAVCANNITVPEGIPPKGAVLDQVVPLLVKTLPLVLGATNWTEDVPLPSITLLAVSVASPVPPLATGRIPVVDTATKSRPFQATRAAAPATTVTPVVGPAPTILMLCVLDVLLMTM
jgi:hypothetical protein